jgi:type I restriction enzyme M protein
VSYLRRLIDHSPESVCDPCLGIADFLSLSYVNSLPKLDDDNLWGIDVDDNMVMLSQINMLLNGDGNAHLLHAKDKGAILYKIRKQGDLIPLQTTLHKNGNWDDWKDDTKLMKFDVILTNHLLAEVEVMKLKLKGIEKFFLFMRVGKYLARIIQVMINQWIRAYSF